MASSRPERATSARKKVAVLGGGMAGLATAFELSRSPDHDVTVYQMGWRLGGKCATGRNREIGHRIEEHGIHLLFGFYENAFDMIREAYDELDRPPGAKLRRWTDAFLPQSWLVLEEHLGGRRREWVDWPLWIPDFGGEPGDHARRGVPAHGIDDLLDQLRRWLEEHALAHPRVVARLARHPHVEGLVREALRLPEDPARHGLGLLGHAWQGLLDAAGRFGDWLHGLDDLARRAWILLELGLRVSYGLGRAWEDGVRDLSELDSMEFTAWLDRQSPVGLPMSDVVRHSAPLRMAYELPLSFRNGDSDRPDLAAGVAIRCLLRFFFDRRGAYAYEMAAGTGESMVAPLYEVLVKRGVKFAFFHRVKRLELSEDGTALEGVKLGIQATPLAGRLGYDPLIELPDKKIRAWPNTPCYERLKQGSELAEGRELASGGYDLESPWTCWRDVDEATLLPGRDFDAAVLAIPLGAVPDVAPDLRRQERWQALFTNLEPIASQAFQLWFDRSTADLGWKRHAEDPHPFVGTYADPYASWKDMSRALDWEEWGADEAPRSLAYLCGPLVPGAPSPGSGPDPGYPKAELDRVRVVARRWIEAHAGHLWRRAVSGGRFRWDWLVRDRDEPDGTDAFQAQYQRSNVDPSSRYTPALHGTTRYRIAPDDTRIDRLFLAGDWTRTGLDIGCVEAAVISARQAARAVRGESAASSPIHGERD